MAALHSMVHRLCKLRLSINSFMNELKKIKEIVKVNGYAMSTVENLVQKNSRKLRKMSLSTFFQYDKKNKILRTANFEFMPPTTNSIRTIYMRLKLFDVIFTTSRKLKQLLSTRDDKRPKLEKSGIYEVTCGCGDVYLGQSKRQVLIRFKEHVSAIKNNHPEKSAIALHAIRELHLNIDIFQLIKPTIRHFSI